MNTTKNHKILMKEKKAQICGNKVHVCELNELILLKYPHHTKQSANSIQFLANLWYFLFWGGGWGSTLQPCT